MRSGLVIVVIPIKAIERPSIRSIYASVGAQLQWLLSLQARLKHLLDAGLFGIGCIGWLKPRPK